MFSNRQLSILHSLHQSRPRERAAIVAGVDNDIIRALSEMSLNVLRGNIPLQHGQKKRLRKHKQTMRSLANRLLSLDTKRRLVQQSGGFLPVLLPIIASVLSGGL